jgi:hypothetical protein
MGVVPCGMTFAERMRSVRIDPAAMETRTRVRYYDADPIREVFGDDAKERMEHDTNGLGFAKVGPDGELYHKDRKTGDVVHVSDEDVDRVYLGGDREQ